MRKVEQLKDIERRKAITDCIQVVTATWGVDLMTAQAALERLKYNSVDEALALTMQEREADAAGSFQPRARISDIP
jgi:hypothetical protein